MTPAEDGLPRGGRSARALGVRVPQDIQPDAEGAVIPGIGGMSVAPGSILNLPNHRRPRAYGSGSTGPDEDRIYAVEDDSLAAHPLLLQPDPNRPTRHATIEPEERTPLESYESALTATREDWTVPC